MAVDFTDFTTGGTLASDNYLVGYDVDASGGEKKWKYDTLMRSISSSITPELTNKINQNSIDGTGTTNRIPKWSDSDTLGDSIMEINTGVLLVSGLSVFSDSPTVRPTTSAGTAKNPTQTSDYHFLSNGPTGLTVTSLDSTLNGDASITLRNADTNNTASTAHAWSIHNDRSEENDLNFRYDDGTLFTVTTGGQVAFSSSPTIGPTDFSGTVNDLTNRSDFHAIGERFTNFAITSIESGGEGDAVLTLRNADSNNSANTASKWSIQHDRSNLGRLDFRKDNSVGAYITAGGNMWINGTLSQGSSDERIKENIELANLELCYQTVKDLPLKRFKFKDFIEAQDQHQLGFIAQEVEKAFPNSVPPDVASDITYTDASGNEVTIEKVKGLSKDQIMMAHYGCTQKLMATVEAQAETIKSLEAQNQAFEARLAALEAK